MLESLTKKNEKIQCISALRNKIWINIYKEFKFKVHLILILKNVFNISTFDKFFQVLKIL